MELTLSNIINSIREISFDRFVSPTFFVVGKVGFQLTVTDKFFRVYDRSNPDTSNQPLIVEVDLTIENTMDKLLYKIINDFSDKIGLSCSASYMGTDPSNILVPISNADISSVFTVHKKHFFSDEKIIEGIKRYYAMYVGYECNLIESLNLNEEIGNLKCASPHHLVLWTSYWLVESRRLYEMAAEMLGQTTFSLTGQGSLGGMSQGGASISMQVGEVFTIQESPQENYNEGERPAGVGADNVLGDAKSFWYKLQLWIRSQVERLFGDFSLRPDTVMVGNIDLQKDINFYAYFDSYPYTVSPLSREILSSFERY